MKMDFRKRNARTRVCRIDHCLIRQIERVWQGVGGDPLGKYEEIRSAAMGDQGLRWL
jgi:hypothetical protein